MSLGFSPKMLSVGAKVPVTTIFQYHSFLGVLVFSQWMPGLVTVEAPISLAAFGDVMLH